MEQRNLKVRLKYAAESGLFTWKQSQKNVSGISWHKTSGKWQLKINKKYYGLFETIADAIVKKDLVGRTDKIHRRITNTESFLKLLSQGILKK